MRGNEVQIPEWKRRNTIGIDMYKIIECTPEEFKEKYKEFEAQGLIISSIEAQPSQYKYKVHFYEHRSPYSLKDEEWRDIPGEFYGFYQLSSLGRFRSMRILRDYDRMVLTIANGKRVTVNARKLFKKIFPEKNA